MPTPEQVQRTIDAYVERFCAGDAAAWAALFAEDGTHEDPVGTSPNEGRAAIQAFYETTTAMMGPLGIEVTQAPVIIGAEAVTCFTATAGEGEGRVRMPHIVDHMTFDDDGRITALRAFWTMDTVIPDPA